MFRQKHIMLLFLLSSILVVSAAVSAAGRIVHSVHVGGPDACIEQPQVPGCERNFTLVALQDADGNVRGQYDDEFSGDATGGFHAVVTCLSISGNDAWISGLITKGTYNGIDIAGWPVATRVEDNGVSANDPADKISYSFLNDARSCTEQVAYPLYDMPKGQVSIR